MKKINFLRKGLVVGVIFLFIGIAVASTNAKNNVPEIVLDQYQHRTYAADNQGPEGKVLAAQSFRPSLDSIVKVVIETYKSGTPPGDVTVSIRQILDGNDLTSISIPANSIPKGWIITEFDFPVMPVITPEITYYIVFESYKDSNGWIGWGYEWSENGTLYPRGERWLWSDLMGGWYTLNYDHWFETYGFDERPNSPIINGPKSDKAGEEYNYTFMSTDPEGHDLQYMIDWGDGTDTGWIGLVYNSGEQISKSHKWDTQGTYTIKAKAKDIYGAESDWGTFTVKMPKNRAVSTPFLQFLQNHPLIYQLLQRLLKL